VERVGLGRRVVEIEAARGIAALGILVYHATQLTDGGQGPLAGVTDRFWLGVPLFFVLSGFLLYRPFAHATLHGTEWPSLRRYGRSRFLRIAPAYVLALTVAILLNEPSLTAPALSVIAMLLWLRALYMGRALGVPILVALFAGVTWVAAPHPLHALYEGLTNYLLVFLPFGPDGNAGPHGVIGPAWSLCIEIGFYAALPLLALLISRIAHRGQTPGSRARSSVAFIALMLAVGVLYALFTGSGRPLPDWLPAYLQLFAVGMLLAIAAELWPVVRIQSSRVLLAGGLAAAVVAQAVFQVGPEAPHSNGASIGYPLVMAGAFALILASVVLCERTTLLGRLLSTRPLVALGTVSYGIFLWHFPLIHVLRRTPLWSSESANIVLVLACTLAAATLSWLLVERRALALKDRPLPLDRLLGRVQRPAAMRPVAIAD
jgi:peptidoglycan/LPS O-acetylase OafA/YrhL